MAFYTIHITPGLSPAAYRRAARVRSPGVTAWRRQHSDLLGAAGFEQIEELDLTDAFLTTTRAWLQARLHYAGELRRVEGPDCDQRISENRTTIRAIEAGLLRRSLFVAVSP